MNMMRLIVILFCFYSANILAIDTNEKKMEARINLGKMGLEFNYDDFFKSVKNTDVLAVKSFIDAGLNISGDIGKATLILAIKNNNKEIVDLLISADKAIELQYKSMLFLSEQNIVIEKESFLKAIREENTTQIEHFANIFYPNDIHAGKQTYFHVALIEKLESSTKVLESKGGRIDMDDPFTYDLFVSEAYRGNIFLLSYFIDKGININQPDSKGNFALINAVRGEQFETTEFLINKKADLKIRDKSLVYAHEYAALSKNKKIYDLFIKHGEIDENNNLNKSVNNSKIGKSIYLEHCSACHQENGEGVIGLFPSLVTSNIASGNREDLIEYINKGNPDNLMPAYENMLSKTDIKALAIYVNKFSTNKE